MSWYRVGGELEIAKKRLAGKALLPDHLNAHFVLGSCPDFLHEKNALQELVESRGHVLVISPKCHPEVAGGGIEYSWGKGKLTYKRSNPAGGGKKDFIGRVMQSMNTETILTLERVWKYERRTRDYQRLYRHLDAKVESNELQREDVHYDLMESHRKTYKSHRNIMDIDRKFVDEN